MPGTEILRMEHIRKVYPNGVVANSDITFAVNQGEIHALSGENGAGKTTLMKMLFGEEQPTRGDIYINGQKVAITSSAAAIRMGIGMVHQHFMLVPSLTVIENMILGMEPRRGLVIDRKLAERQVAEISEKYNLLVPPHAKVQDLSVGQKQKVEILKALLHGAKIMILDEPTAVLTPQETRELFHELKILRGSGYTIIFISHKLNEVRELCDRITIIRRGRTMGVYTVKDVDEEQISHLMVGRDVALYLDKKPSRPGEPAIEVEKLTVRNVLGQKKLDGVSFRAKRGEVFGVAGVEGNGQTELVEALSRNQDFQEGTIRILGKDIRGMSIRQLRGWKVSHIPEDRMTTGIAGSLSITENAMADKSCDPEFIGWGTLLRRKNIKSYGQRMVERYNIFCKDPDEAVSSLSGGNIQKVVLARELSSHPEVIIADQPTRGVDVGATEFIRRELLQLRDEGKCVFLVSSDLNELLGLADRLIVLYGGRITAYFPDTSSITEDDVGRYMLGVNQQSDQEIAEVAK